MSLLHSFLNDTGLYSDVPVDENSFCCRRWTACTNDVEDEIRVLLTVYKICSANVIRVICTEYEPRDEDVTTADASLIKECASTQTEGFFVVPLLWSYKKGIHRVGTTL